MNSATSGFVIVIVIVIVIVTRFRNVRKDGVKDGKGKTAREGSVSDPIDIQIVKEETIEVDKGDDGDVVDDNPNQI